MQGALESKHWVAHETVVNRASTQLKAQAYVISMPRWDMAQPNTNEDGSTSLFHRLSGCLLTGGKAVVVERMGGRGAEGFLKLHNHLAAKSKPERALQQHPL